MASPPRLVADERVVLPCVSWETYERLLADDEERRVPRMTHDQGVLELVTPSMPHEEGCTDDYRASSYHRCAPTMGRPDSAALARQPTAAKIWSGASSLMPASTIQNEERIRGKSAARPYRRSAAGCRARNGDELVRRSISCRCLQAWAYRRSGAATVSGSTHLHPRSARTAIGSHPTAWPYQP